MTSASQGQPTSCEGCNEVQVHPYRFESRVYYVNQLQSTASEWMLKYLMKNEVILNHGGSSAHKAGKADKWQGLLPLDLSSGLVWVWFWYRLKI
jgi:hypothetical protein